MDEFWRTPGWEEGDKHLSALKRAPFVRPFPFLLPMQDGLYFLRGPRQIGKTSCLKTLLSEAVKQGQSVFFLSCENVRDQQDLAEILKSVRYCRYVFLDEVNFVSGWDRAVKHAVDSGKTQILILTGSHAADIRRGLDQMPGRWGAGKEWRLLPMDLEEFCRMRSMARWPVITRLEELRLYFRVGGFPLALQESGETGREPLQTRKIYQRWLSGDIQKLGKQEIYLRELMGQIARTMTVPISLQSLAAKTQMGSHHTAQEYVGILEDCFALKTLYFLNPDEDVFHFRKNKKFYFRDPLIYWLALSWSGQKAPAAAEERLAEMVAHEAISSRYQRMGYYQTAGGEIDFIGGYDWAIEVKWGPIPLNLSSTFKQYRSPLRIVWTHSNFLKEWPPAGSDGSP